ncbi:MAG TPA: hypothetical protein PKH23_01735 [Bacillota bacterium]|nr:hypothetical protein [Bacillota bacterium]
MRIEILYGELANLLGEHGSQNLLLRTFGEEHVLMTPFPEKPAFPDGGIDLVYMGPMTERSQARVLEVWRGQRALFREAIDRGTAFFFAGNALDLTGRTIAYEEGETIEGLGLYPFDTFCRRYDRLNEVFRGEFQKMDITGFRSQFTTHKGDLRAFPFIRTAHGSGMIPGTPFEGIRDKLFFATNLLGPFLLLNPPFTKWLFAQIGFDGPLPFEDALMRSYQMRQKDFEESFPALT